MADLNVRLEAEMVKIGAQYDNGGWYIGGPNAGLDIGVSPDYVGYDLSAGFISAGVEGRFLIPGIDKTVVIRLEGDAFSAGYDSGITCENRDGVAGLTYIVPAKIFGASVFFGIEVDMPNGSGGR